jgi:hypothetical protein
MVTTFAMAVFGWIFFRAQDLTHAINYIKGIFTDDLFKKPNLPELADLSIAFIIFFMIIEWFGRENKYALENFGMKWFAPLRWLFYSFLIVCVIVLSGKEQEFIYFQF